MADDHEHWSVRVHLLGCAEKADAIVGDEICQIVLGAEKRPQ